MSKTMPLDDFRALRIVLEPDDYAMSSGEPEHAPSDLIREETWRHLTVLPDEAAVRTSNRHGTLFANLTKLAGTWAVCVGDSEPADPVGLSMIEMINEPDAALFNLLVGFYRQAVDSLRIVLESVVIGAYCQLTHQETTLDDWLEGNREIKFDQAVSALQGCPEIQPIHMHLVASLRVGFADQANSRKAYQGGWVRQLYRDLSKYSHGRPLFNNTSLWRSNGPIYVWHVVAIVAGLFLETFVASYVLVKLCRPDFELPPEAREAFEADDLPLPEWAQVSDAARSAFAFTFGGSLKVGA